MDENVSISIKISLKFVPKGPINNIRALVQIIAWRGQATSHYLNQLWPIYRRIYASLGLNELTLIPARIMCFAVGAPPIGLAVACLRGQGISLAFKNLFNQPTTHVCGQQECMGDHAWGDHASMIVLISVRRVRQAPPPIWLGDRWGKFFCLDPGGQINYYRKVSNIRRTKSQNLTDSRLVLKLSVPNPLKLGIKSRMKM